MGEGWMWIGLWWASNEYGHGGNISRDVKDLMGINSDGKWVRYEYREMVSGYEKNGYEGRVWWGVEWGAWCEYREMISGHEKNGYEG